MTPTPSWDTFGKQSYFFYFISTLSILYSPFHPPTLPSLHIISPFLHSAFHNLAVYLLFSTLCNPPPPFSLSLSHPPISPPPFLLASEVGMSRVRLADGSPLSLDIQGGEEGERGYCGRRNKEEGGGKERLLKRGEES